MDTWISLAQLETNGERNRGLYVLKSRGMNHSNQIREYQLTAQGVKLVDAYLGLRRVLTGSARLTQEAIDEAATPPRRGCREAASRGRTQACSRSNGRSRTCARRWRARRRSRASG